jgi:hypothetical protein
MAVLFLEEVLNGTALGKRDGDIMINTPIILIDKCGHDLSIFKNVDEAIKEIEPIDVRNDEFDCFDSDGRLLAVSIKSTRIYIAFGLIPYRREYIHIESGEELPSHAEELKERVKSFLRALSIEEDIYFGKSLHELIAIAKKYG